MIELEDAPAVARDPNDAEGQALPNRREVQNASIGGHEGEIRLPPESRDVLHHRFGAQRKLPDPIVEDLRHLTEDLFLLLFLDDPRDGRVTEVVLHVPLHHEGVVGEDAHLVQGLP